MAGDREILQRISTGDKDAMRQFYQIYHDPLIGFVRGRGVDPASAADIVQDAMLEVWRFANRFRGEASAKTWLFTIARNKIVDGTRKTKRLSWVETVPEVVDEAPDPEAVTIAAADAKRVRDCLKALKRAHHTMIRLAFYDDLTYQEISEIEGIPAGTVKTRIHHAKRLLLRCLGAR